MHFDYIHLTIPNSSQVHPHLFMAPTLCLFKTIIHRVQFVLLAHSWVWSHLLNCGWSTRDTPLKRTDFPSPRSSQMPTAPSLSMLECWLPSSRTGNYNYYKLPSEILLVAWMVIWSSRRQTSWMIRYMHLFFLYRWCDGTGSTICRRFLI